ncbi:hypothetical protein BGZ51_009484 [Haplosporangium sp. Z 767]|nr:hypothetical protein BGZ51_009484 [Haplosporangium sp. Z 767]KAF9191846.1 hypothetical protein BGZ50_009065 [Haplosporangium sp. Z 11]
MSIAGNTPEGTGHVGTLTPEQTQTLKNLWKAIYEIQEKGTVTITPDPVKAPVAAPVAASTGWGGGWFSSAPAVPAEPVVEPPMTITLEEIGLTSAQLRQTIWDNALGDNPDSLVLRFLRARKWHVGNGLTMLLKAFKWRVEQNVEDVKVFGEEELDQRYPKFMHQLRIGKFWIHGTDKKNSPVVYLNVHLHRAGDQDYKTLERLTIYLMETGRLLIQAPVETVTLVFDLSQFGLANMDYNVVKLLISLFEQMYPEVLSALILHNAPLVFWGAWKIIEGWLDPVVATKIKFTYTAQDLLDLIPAEHLPDTFQGAGLDKFQYKYLEPVPGENDLMKDEATKAQLIKEWNALCVQYDAKTHEWMSKNAGEGDAQATEEREAIAKALHTQYYKMEPYIRARNQFHRKDAQGHSVLQPDGSVVWSYNN